MTRRPENTAQAALSLIAGVRKRGEGNILALFGFGEAEITVGILGAGEKA